MSSIQTYIKSAELEDYVRKYLFPKGKYWKARLAAILVLGKLGDNADRNKFQNEIEAYTPSISRLVISKARSYRNYGIGITCPNLPLLNKLPYTFFIYFKSSPCY